MDLRIFTEPQQGASYADLLRVARAAQDAGFDGFFRSDHYRAMGGSSGEPGPTDAWTTLSALAVQTERIRLGTLVTSATFRLPGPLAIEVAQADQMSGGRIELGLGAGWFEAEHTAYGIPFPPVAERFARLTEQLEIVTGLWGTPTGETYSFSGDHYTVVDSPALPQPAHPIPVIVGGMGKRRTPVPRPHRPRPARARRVGCGAAALMTNGHRTSLASASSTIWVARAGVRSPSSKGSLRPFTNAYSSTATAPGSRCRSSAPSSRAVVRSATSRTAATNETQSTNRRTS